MNWKPLLPLAIGIGVLCQAPVVLAANDEKPTAASVWSKLSEAESTPNVPDEWRKQRPAPAEIDKWRGPESERLLKLGDDAVAFAKAYPTDENASAALNKAADAYVSAMRLGNPNGKAKVTALDEQRLQDPKLSVDSRLEIRLRQIQRTAEAKLPEGQAAAMQSLLEGARTLHKEFKDRTEPFELMLMAVRGESADVARPVLEEILKSDAPDDVKEPAKRTLSRLNLVGKPLDLKFTALDGKEVDIQKMKGQVVLLDFWATWCGPCIAKLPEVKAVYQKLHGPKFEILGINLDDNKERLTTFLKEREISWPQAFDGKRWESAIPQRFGIDAIPALWLVDGQGVLRDLEAGPDLEKRVQKLIDEIK